MRSYILLFVTTGSLAVVFKLLGENSHSRLAGLVAMVPLKIVLAWSILGAAGGVAAVRASIPGMAIGLVALVALLGVGWIVAGRVGVVGTIAIGVATWAAVAFGLQTVPSRGSAETAAEDGQ